jgi:Deoxyribonuclease NucA/NucB
MYPILSFDWTKHPILADNIWQAQMAGHPKVLTYTGPDLTIRKTARGAAMHFKHGGLEYEIPHVLSRDEYPFACTAEGGKASWVGHIPSAQNSAQGGLIAAFLKANDIRPQTKFIVKVKNHPKGPVTNSCKMPPNGKPCPTCMSGCFVGR